MTTARFAMAEVQQRIERALEQAESEIREVGAEAFRSGADSNVGQAQEIVTALRALRADLNGSPSPTASRHERKVRKEGRAKTRRSGKAAKRASIRSTQFATVRSFASASRRSTRASTNIRPRRRRLTLRNTSHPSATAGAGSGGRPRRWVK